MPGSLFVLCFFTYNTRNDIKNVKTSFNITQEREVKIGMFLL